MYMIYGGLSIDFFSDGMQEDLIDKMSLMIKSIDRLSKHTHIEPQTFNISDKVVNTMATETLDIVHDILQLTNECRSEVREFIHDEMYSRVNDVLNDNVFDALDDKSTNTTVDSFDLEYFTITDINESTIAIEGEGTVYCNLQYGSGSDLRNDIGMVMDHSFPMTFECTAPISDPSDIDLHPSDIKIDDSAWYGEN